MQMLSESAVCPTWVICAMCSGVTKAHSRKVNVRLTELSCTSIHLWYIKAIIWYSIGLNTDTDYL